jgi:hypothetical protein
MRKFYSLLCALAIVLSASAAPMNLRPIGKKQLTKDAIVNHVRKAAPKAPAQLNGEVINIEANNLAVDLSYFDLYLEYRGYGLFWIEGGTDDYAVSAELYTEDENYYTTFSTAEESIELTVNETALTVSSAEFRSTEKGDQFVATAVDEDGNTYNINLTFFAPDEPKAEINLDFGEGTGKYYAEDADWYFTGERADYLVTLDIVTTPEIEGSYTKEDFLLNYTGLYTVDGEDTTKIEGIFDANATIVLKDGVYNIAADLFLGDENLYHVKLQYVKPVATDTVRYTFEEPVSIDDFGGDFYFVAKSDKYLLYMDYYSTTIAGEFALADLYTDYVGLYTINGTDTASVAYEDVSLKVVEDETGYDVTVNYLATDLTCYIFTLRSNKAVVDEVVQINLDNADHQDISASSWYYGFSHYVLAANADSSFVAALAIANDEFIGSFTEADLNQSYTGVFVNEVRFAIASAEFSVAAGQNGSFVLTGWMLAKNNVKYEFVIKTAEEGQTEGIENIELTEQVQKVSVDGQLFIIRDNKVFNAIGTRVR